MSKRTKPAQNGHIRTTLGQLAAAEQVLVGRVGLLLWPPRTADTIRKLTARVRVETRRWHEQREQWIRELGETRGDTTTVAGANWSEFTRRLNELAVVEVALPGRPLSFAELEQAEEESPSDPRARRPARFSPAELTQLGPLLADAAETETR